MIFLIVDQAYFIRFIITSLHYPKLGIPREYRIKMKLN